MYISEIVNGSLKKSPVTMPVFEKSYDVIVSGLGTAGSMAALMSAENGLTVLGVESFNCIGGTSTIGGVQGHYFGCPGGRYIEVDKKVNEFQERYTYNQLESRKIVVEELLIKNRVDISYESRICGIYMEGNTVVGVKVITPDGIKSFETKVLMDCTGDAYTAHMAGCECEYGRQLDGLTQPYSMVSLVRTIDGVRCTNCDFGRVNQQDDKELSDAIIFSRAYEMSEERGNDCFLMHMPLIGIREGRRIVAEETVKLEDFLLGKHTAEPAFYSYADLDKHGWDVAFDGETLGDWSIGANLGAYNVTIPVPYKSIIPKKIDGMLVPCRALGVDRDTSSCVRMVPDMKKLGEVAADIAKLAILHSCAIRDVPYHELRNMLIESGCLDTTHNRGYWIDGWRDYDGSPLLRERVFFIAEPEKLKARLATDKPGIAIWSARLMGENSIKVLKTLLESEDENTQKHAAFALAINGDKSGVGVLRDMVKMRDGFMLKDCRKHNQQRGCMAIYFLGRLADTEITDTLIEIISDENEPQRQAYNQEFAMGTRYKILDFKSEYFQFVSNAVVALIRIGDAHARLRGKIAGAFGCAFKDDGYYNRFTQRPPKSSEGGMVINIKDVANKAIEKWRI